MLGILNTILPYIIYIVLFSVLLVLIIGIIAMLKGGDFNKRWGNKLMRARVALQGLAVILILLTAYLLSQ
ncbi:MAG: twin transmembrane helix small protein [Alphaproteobacteria bacterium]|nr:twin transmembrane helix small protein [Alphaproteobacteria bacterium]